MRSARSSRTAPSPRCSTGTRDHPTREPDLVGPQPDPAHEFLRLACLTYGADDPVRRLNARSMLAAQPGLGADDVHVAAARADGVTLLRLLAADPALANQ